MLEPPKRGAVRRLLLFLRWNPKVNIVDAGWPYFGAESTGATAKSANGMDHTVYPDVTVEHFDGAATRIELEMRGAVDFGEPATRLRSISASRNQASHHRTSLTDPADAPRLDANAALLMVDPSLTAVGAHVPCTLADIQSAFRHLTDPLVAEAIYTDAMQTSIVFRSI